MATVTTKYFSGTQQVEMIFAMPNKQFRSTFNSVDALKYDGFHMMVGYIRDPATGIPDRSNPLPITRKVHFKKNPSLHKCDARCVNAKGHSCECSCGGKNHGAGR